MKYFNCKYIFPSEEIAKEKIKAYYLDWDPEGRKVQTLESGPSVIWLGPNGKTEVTPDGKIFLPDGQIKVDIVDEKPKYQLRGYLIVPESPDHLVNGIENYQPE